MDTKPPLPPFTVESARQKVRMAEDAWNTRDPDRVVLVYNHAKKLLRDPNADKMAHRAFERLMRSALPPN